jgi:hypothetical protein
LQVLEHPSSTSLCLVIKKDSLGHDERKRLNKLLVASTYATVEYITLSSH